MDHVSFIVGGYVVTFIAVGAYVLRMFRQARKINGAIAESDKPWR
jgi:CcmD family protein